MWDATGVNLTGTGEHMVEFLLTDRSTTESLLSLRIIMEHKKGHISHERELAAEQRTRGKPASECPVMSVAGGHFKLLSEQTKWQGQGAKRPGAEHVATCPSLSSAKKATEKQASRRDHPSLH